MYNDHDEETNPVRNELAEYVNLKVANNTDMMQWSDRHTQFLKQGRILLVGARGQQ